MTTNEKPMSKRAQAKERAAAKIDARRQEVADLTQARVNASNLTKSMPPEHSEWGVIRIRAYVKMLEILAHRVTLKTIGSRELRANINYLNRMKTCDVHHCSEFVTDTGIHERTKLFDKMGELIPYPEDE